MTAVVLVHGGGFDGRCWELLLPHLEAPGLAVDLPGRGRHPMPLDDVTFAACAEAVTADVDAAGFDEIVLVGHSLAGCSMPAIIGRLSDRVRHAVFIGCTVPENGCSAFDTLDPEVQALAAARLDSDETPRGMDAAMARIVLGDDLDETQFAWCVERFVAEAPRLTTERVSLGPLRGVASTWVRTMRDLAVSPEKQLRFAGNVGDCRVVDLDAGHMCMVSQPTATAAIVNDLAV